MDAVQFGRWIYERRRKCGFASQRALAERAHHDSALTQLEISEAFLARLETGMLVHPFRGSVRRRVLGLAELLCKTSRDVTTYLHVAELTKLDASETEQMALLRQRLSAPQKQHVLPLPPRPRRLFGRQPIVQQLLDTLCSMESGLFLLTGMPGVGKSALAAEVVHVLTTNTPQSMRVFPDGIAAFSCTAYRGHGGLLALCENIIAVFDPRSAHAPTERIRASERKLTRSTTVEDADLTRAMNHVRLALANTSILLLLDDLDTQFPLRQAMDALLSQDQQTLATQGVSRPARTHHVIFATSRSQFSPAIVAQHMHLEPPEPEAALAYLASLLKRPLLAEELDAAHRLCAAIGYLPLAIEAAAHAIATGIPLSLLAASIVEYPLTELLENEHELRTRLKLAFAPLNPDLQKHFALLSSLGASSFGLESAAALHMQPVYELVTTSGDSVRPISPARDSVSLQQLTSTALDLGQFVRHSLIDLLPTDPPFDLRRGDASRVRGTMKAVQGSLGNFPTVEPPPQVAPDTHEDASPHSLYARYRLHPVLSAYASTQLYRLQPEDIEAARRNIQTYALTYLERYRGEIKSLLRERDLLFHAFMQALRTEQYAQVVQFANGLAPISCRLPTYNDGTHLFLWAIQASQNLHDRHQQVRLLSNLGWLYCQRGEFPCAQQAWHEALEMATTLQGQAPALGSLLGLAHLAHIHDEEEIAIRYAEQYLHHCEEDDNLFRIAFAHTHLATYTRVRGDMDGAYKHVHEGIRTLSHFDTLSASSTTHYVDLRIHIEQARVLGDYSCSQEYTERAATFTYNEEEYYDCAGVLLDQAHFALQQMQLHDVHDLARRVVQTTERLEMPYFRQRGLQLLGNERT